MSASLSFKDVHAEGREWGVFRIKQRRGPLEGELSQAARHGVSIIASLRDGDAVIPLFHSPAACCRWARKMDPIRSPCLWDGWGDGGPEYISQDPVRKKKTTLNISKIWFSELGIQVIELPKSHTGNAIQSSASTRSATTASSLPWGCRGTCGDRVTRAGAGRHRARTTREAGTLEAEAIQRELEPQKRCSCCQTLPKVLRERAKYPGFSPFLAPSGRSRPKASDEQPRKRSLQG